MTDSYSVDDHASWHSGLTLLLPPADSPRASWRAWTLKGESSLRITAPLCS